ncbi:MAG TPA: Crp/Fnr family transcriptional regulator [bacterium]
MEIQSFLSKIFLFESLSEDQIELVAASLSIKSINKGEHLFSELQAATAFFYVISGSLKIYKLSADGAEQIIHIQNAGDLVAEAIMFEFDTYPAFCQALEDTQLIRFSKSEFLTLLHHFPEIAFRIMSAYSRRLRQLIAKIEDLSLHDIKARLANYLINHYSIKNGKKIVELPYTKKDLASILGTIPETLSRTLNAFKKNGLISEEKNEIELLSLVKLKSICN